MAMGKAFIIIALVIGFIVGGLLLLRSSAGTPVPPDVLEKARKRNAELAKNEEE
jgi:F0F1-type ATP synthase assembly protein I